MGSGYSQTSASPRRSAGVRCTVDGATAWSTIIRILTIAGALVVALAPSGVFAAITAFWTRNTITPSAILNDPLLANMQSWSLRVSYTNGDWAFAGLRATLPGAPGVTYYKHPQGGFTKPNPANFINFPALEFTSYIASVADNGVNQQTFVLDSFPEGLPDGPGVGNAGSISPGIFNFSWGDLAVTPGPQNGLEIARLTFPNPVAPPSVQIHPQSITGQINPEFDVLIPRIPEPAALGFVAAGFLMICRLPHRLSRGKPCLQSAHAREDP